MNTYTCDCKVCKGVSFTAPDKFFVGQTPKTVKTMVHNYAQMVRNPAMASVMAFRGMTLVK